MTAITRRAFLKLAAGGAAALGLGPRPAPVAETLEAEANTVLGGGLGGAPVAEAEPKRIGGRNATLEVDGVQIIPELATFKDGTIYITYATAAPDATIEWICREEHLL